MWRVQGSACCCCCCRRSVTVVWNTTLQAELVECQDEAYSAKLATKRYRERLQSAKVGRQHIAPAGGSL